MPRLAAGPLANALRRARPIYILDVHQPDPKALIPQVRTGEDGIALGKLLLPDWQESKAALPPLLSLSHAHFLDAVETVAKSGPYR